MVVLHLFRFIKNMKNILFAVCFLILGNQLIWSQKKEDKTRIITLSGAITEIVCSLGFEKQIVGRDVTGSYPATLTAKDLGHVRSVSIESVLALKPTLILASEKDMNPDLASRLKASGIKTHILKQELSIQGTKNLITEIAAILGAKNHKELISKIDKSLSAVKPLKKAPKILFVYARGANMMMVSGKDTPVDKMITIAGGQNAVTGFGDYKPLTPEALLSANPDYILFFDSGLKSLGGVEGALKIDGILKTNAGRNKNIISMDGALLSGFGPRAGEGAATLNKLISG
jgi:iron complex transport system substrate-binding protein